MDHLSELKRKPDSDCRCNRSRSTNKICRINTKIFKVLFSMTLVGVTWSYTAPLISDCRRWYPYVAILGRKHRYNKHLAFLASSMPREIPVTDEGPNYQVRYIHERNEPSLLRFVSEFAHCVRESVAEDVGSLTIRLFDRIADYDPSFSIVVYRNNEDRILYLLDGDAQQLYQCVFNTNQPPSTPLLLRDDRPQGEGCGADEFKAIRLCGGPALPVQAFTDDLPSVSELPQRKFYSDPPR